MKFVLALLLAATPAAAWAAGNPFLSGGLAGQLACYPSTGTTIQGCSGFLNFGASGSLTVGTSLIPNTVAIYSSSPGVLNIANATLQFTRTEGTFPLDAHSLGFVIADTANTSHLLKIQGRYNGTDVALQVLDSVDADGFQFQMSSTGFPAVAAYGSDTDINVQILPKGAASVVLSNTRPLTNNTYTLGTAGVAWASVNATVYNSGASTGVTCSAGISATTGRSVGGIVTHC